MRVPAHFLDCPLDALPRRRTPRGRHWSLAEPRAGSSWEEKSTLVAKSHGPVYLAYVAESGNPGLPGSVDGVAGLASDRAGSRGGAPVGEDRHSST